MAGLARKIARKIPELIGNPRKALALLRRAFPISVMARDPEAYHLVSAWTYGRAPRVPVEELFPGIRLADVTIVRGLDRLEDVAVSMRELVTVAALVKHTRARRVLEVGTSNGNTTVNIAANLEPGGGVVTVDLPLNWDGAYSVDVPESMRNVTNRAIVGQHYRESSFATRVEQVFADSATLDWSTLGGPFDVVFIDANHSYEYVRMDTMNALKVLRPGGVLLWHDYGTIEDVSRAVDEFSGKLKISVVLSTSLAVATP